MKPSNVLNIESLDNEWRDKDSIMLHACFQLLKDCVDHENLLECHVDWNSTEKLRLAKIEIIALYQWWLAYTETGVPNWETNNLENIMLKRLIDIRWALWT